MPDSLSPLSPSLLVLRRSGHVQPFDQDRIRVAILKAYVATHGAASAGSPIVRDWVAIQVHTVVSQLRSRPPEASGTVSVEAIQDEVETVLMHSDEHDVARAYVLYRENRRQAREQAQQICDDAKLVVPSQLTMLLRIAHQACDGLSAEPAKLARLASRDLYAGADAVATQQALVLAARGLIEQDPVWAKVAARLLLLEMYRDLLPGASLGDAQRYAEYFVNYVHTGIRAGLLDPRLGEFDLSRLAAALAAERDYQFDYLGLQTLYDRYFLHIDERRIELPQVFFMRVAMGLAINEIDREARAIEFYHVLSRFEFMSSTPTLFNAGTRHSQLSSCYLTTVSDDLDGIYQAIKENALLQKYAGGLGNDWTPVRALGSRIKGTNGKSQGVVPFLKVVNDTAVAVNQGGKRRGAVCAYLETWHLDIEEFLDLRKNTGDDRRRTHDMNTANWIPDLFMRRVMENGDWTLFSPSDVPDLHDLYGKAFEAAYARYEAMADAGAIRHFKRVPAVQMWRKMLGMLFETGHPWMTFKDPCNIRSPQQHVGVVHGSNLCTEITLNTSESEIAVCNLGSVNLVAHLQPDGQGGRQIDLAKLQRTIRVAMRMLDNVVDVNFYAVGKARNANLKHRPVGLGIMGFQDCLYAMRMPYASEAAIEFADRSMEAVCYYAYSASNELAAERGRYSSYTGSLWDRGILPQDSIDLLLEQRGGYVEVDRSSTLDWDALRERIRKYGMRNSNCVAIAPTATISNIVGVSASIEPAYQNIYVKSNLSGEFTLVNEYLVRDLKALSLWDEVMVGDIKYFDGSLAKIDRIPADLRRLYATAFEIDAQWLVECAARRQKWIDQAQSLNIYLAGASGKKLDETYKLAWLRGLKTTYYLRTLGATRAEKSTGQGGELNAVSVGQGAESPKFCAIDDPGCEACQ